MARRPHADLTVEPLLLTLAEAGRRLNLTEGEVIDLVRLGRLPVIWIRGTPPDPRKRPSQFPTKHYRIPTAGVEEFVRTGRCTRPGPKAGEKTRFRIG